MKRRESRQELHEGQATRASEIRLIVTDVDGVWTDGRIIYAGEAGEIKEFNVRDGLGVKIAQRAGMEVAVVTSRSSKAVERRCRELGITACVQHADDKLRVVQKMAHERELTLGQVCYIGDDLPDLAVIRSVGLSAAPFDACSEVIAAASWHLSAAGGRGAVRELIERLLRERGEWDAIVRDFHVSKLTAQGV